MKIIGIYKIENPKGRIYIGQSNDINKRLKQYEKLTINIKNQPKLYRSLLKYGYNNHHPIIIEECPVEQLNERERYWQDYYDVLNGGLNCKLTKTDDLSGDLSQETKEKIGNSNRGRPKPYGFGNKMSKIHTGKTRSLKTRDKMSKSHKKIEMSQEWIKNRADSVCKPILQYDLEGNFIQEWKSSKAFLISINKFPNGDLSSCLKGKHKQNFGYQWKYKTKNYPLKIEDVFQNRILQYSTNNELIKDWGNITSIKKTLRYSPSCITKNIKGVTDSAYGYVWKLKNINKI